jgi:hypothetical protein
MTGLLVAAALHWAVLACQAGKPNGDCRTMVAIVSVESSGCRDLVGDDGKSFGCSQVSVAAAREVGYKGRISVLAQNPRINVEVGAAYLSYCMNVMEDWRSGVACYNMGPVNAKTLTPEKIRCYPYVLKVLARLPDESSPTVPRHQDVDALVRECRADTRQALNSQTPQAIGGLHLSPMPNQTAVPVASDGPVGSQATLLPSMPHRDVLAGPSRKRILPDRVYSLATSHQAVR